MSTLGAAVTAAGVFAVLAVNAAIAAVAVRYFRLSLSTSWGAVAYTAVLVPLAYVVTTLVAFGALGIGAGVTIDTGTLVAFVWAVPFALGASFDLFWMPPPEEVDVPEA
jgi:hypothetical protein